MSESTVTVTKSDTGFNVHFGEEMVVGVHNEQASTEKKAIQLAKKIYADWKESNESRGTTR